MKNVRHFELRPVLVHSYFFFCILHVKVIYVTTGYGLYFVHGDN